MAIDFSYWLSYKTYRVVRVRDPRLGLIHYGLMVAVLAYIGVYVLWWKRGYYESASSVGEVALKIKGSAYSFDSNNTLYPWSSEDLVQPSVERSATFVATNVILTSNQLRGYCGVPDLNCTVNSDCKVDLPLMPGVCSNGYCQSFQWCPAENITEEGHAANNSASIEYNIENADSLTIWMKATLAFPSLDPSRNYSTVYQSEPVSAPDKHQNLFKLGQLLAMTGTTYDDIQTRGCILLVKLDWECYLNSDDLCTPVVRAARLDNRTVNTGFNFRMPSYYRDPNGELNRDVFKYAGVRIFFASQGVGYLISVPTIVLQLSSGLAMMTVATLVTDLALEYVLPERKKYTKYKYLETEDFLKDGADGSARRDYGALDPSVPILTSPGSLQ